MSLLNQKMVLAKFHFKVRKQGIRENVTIATAKEEKGQQLENVRIAHTPGQIISGITNYTFWCFLCILGVLLLGIY